MRSEQSGIQPVEKAKAPPEVKVLLKDLQDTMGIPWAPANWRSYAAYPRLFQLFWERLRPGVGTERFLRDALEITELAYREVSRWYRPDYRPDLPETDLQRLEWELDAFEFGNPQLLIQQAVLSRALRGESVGSEEEHEPRHSPSSYRRPEIEMVDEAHASGEVKTLYQNIRETFGLPLVNSDYQALAKWPKFFLPAWEDSKPWRNQEEYLRVERALVQRAEEAADRLSPPVRLDERELRAAVDRPEDLEKVRETVQMFTDLLPGLVLSDALFRIGAASGQSVEPLRPEGEVAPRQPTWRDRAPAVLAGGLGMAVAAGLLGAGLGLAGYWLLFRRR